MTLRANPGLDRVAIQKIIDASVGVFGAYSDTVLGGVAPEEADNPLDEPINIAPRMAGMGLVAQSALKRCGADNFIPLGHGLAEDALGHKGPFSRVTDRLFSRACLSGVQEGAERSEAFFAEIGRSRDAGAHDLGSGRDLDVPFDEKVLRRLKHGDDASDLLEAIMRAERAASAPSTVEDISSDTGRNLADVTHAATAARSLVDDTRVETLADPLCTTALRSSLAAVPSPQALSAQPFPLLFADLPLSGFWERYSKHKGEQGEWDKEEQVSSKSTLKLVIDVVGDKPLNAYTPQDMEAVRSIHRALPSNYAQAKPWKDIYDHEGPSAVVKKSAGLKLDRVGKKTWNKNYSRLSGLFDYAADGLGSALPHGSPNPCKGLFLSLKHEKNLTPRQRDDRRRVWTDEEIERMFKTPKYLGAASASRWRKSGFFVVRDHRYWLPIIGFTHGMRREEPVALLVRHVKCCPDSGIWYFDLEDPEVVALLKANGSPRLVPLHRVLLALGFLAARVHGRDPDERLFPDAETSAAIGGDASPFGQWFLLFRRSFGVADKEADFHAARTTVIDRLDDAGVSDSHIEALCGHESRERRSEVDTYKRAKKLRLLQAAIDKLVMPIDVEALKQAVKASDTVDRGAAWPNMNTIQKWKGQRRQKDIEQGCT